MMREVALYLDKTCLKLTHNFIKSVTRRIEQGIDMTGGLKNSYKSEILM